MYLFHWTASIIIVAQSKNLLAFDCSSNAQVPYDGDRIIQASAAYTCSWVITVPENYTVKLTISKNNFASVGNTNCVNDYVQHFNSKDSRWWKQHEHLVEENVQLKPRSFCVPLNWKANVGGIQFNSNKQLLPSFLQEASWSIFLPKKYQFQWNLRIHYQSILPIELPEWHGVHVEFNRTSRIAVYSRILPDMPRYLLAQRFVVHAMRGRSV